jgi:hypothetical protein
MVGATIDPREHPVLGGCHREGIASLFWYGLLRSLMVRLVWLTSAFETFRQLTYRVLVLMVTGRVGGRVLSSAALLALELLCNTLWRCLWGDC